MRKVKNGEGESKIERKTEGENVVDEQDDTNKDWEDLRSE